MYALDKSGHSLSLSTGRLIDYEMTNIIKEFPFQWTSKLNRSRTLLLNCQKVKKTNSFFYFGFGFVLFESRERNQKSIEKQTASKQKYLFFSKYFFL